MQTILHGGDYNPEQWLKYPGVIDEDFRLFQLAHLNSITIGVFSWAALEPEEGFYQFDWMDDIFDRADRQGIKVILATPSGGKPNWLALKYPEVRRVLSDGRREPQQTRHNHCLTSPIYREKVLAINTRLAERYGGRSSLVLWHISNEFGGHCHCDLCFAAFQEWLKAKYGTLEALNEAYWAHFWSHTYTSWDQIRSIDSSVGGLVLDWKRFMTHQCRSFIRNEAEPLRRLTPQIPITTNLMPFADSYNYWELAKELDLVSWDSYPRWHATDAEFDETKPALEVAFNHNIFRSMKQGTPFLLMETTPSQVNWTAVSPLRRPGVHRLNGLQAVAHGADAVCYFQLRQSRGSCEQFHGAVIGHAGHENTRVFREVADLGSTLEKLSKVAGTRVPARAAILYDWENRWALEQSASPQNENKQYVQTAIAQYRPFWRRGVPVDVIDSEAELDPYAIVIAPMLFMLRRGQAERLARFVERGGTLAATYQTGWVDETMLCFRGGAPGPLRELLGLWVEEFDALPDAFERRVIAAREGGHGLMGVYKGKHYFDIVHPEGAEVLATFGDDFYAGQPALTMHRFGQGRAYYMASRNDERFIDDLYGFLINDLSLPVALENALPRGVCAQWREREGERYLFVCNFTANKPRVELGTRDFVDAETGERITETLVLEKFGSRVLRPA